MKTFEEQRQEYFKKLKKYIHFFQETAKEKKNEKLVETLLNPQNEKELEFGNYYIMYIEDLLNLSINASCENIIEINPEKSIYVEYLSIIINELRNNASVDAIKQINEKYMKNGSESLAKLLYEMLVLTITNPEGLVKSLYEKYGINMDDELEVMRLTNLIKKANEQLQPEIIPVTEQQMNDFISLVKYHHEFCVNGIKDSKHLELQEVLSEILPDDEPTEGFTKSRQKNNN